MIGPGESRLSHHPITNHCGVHIFISMNFLCLIPSQYLIWKITATTWLPIWPTIMAAETWHGARVIYNLKFYLDVGRRGPQDVDVGGLDCCNWVSVSCDAFALSKLFSYSNWLFFSKSSFICSFRTSTSSRTANIKWLLTRSWNYKNTTFEDFKNTIHCSFQPSKLLH